MSQHPEIGYTHEVYVDQERELSIPVILAAAPMETSFDLLVGMITQLGDVVDVVLESSHDDNLGHSKLTPA